MKLKQQKAFTLIELMVVVAVIAILATLAVTNFSAAIKRTRNAGRQSDVLAVTKALETCYDVPSGQYSGLGNSVLSGVSGFDSAVANLRNADCLNDKIEAKMANYPYELSSTLGPPQTFVACSLLEKVANYEKVGNAKSLAGENCDSSVADECKYFCVKNQQ